MENFFYILILLILDFLFFWISQNLGGCLHVHVSSSSSSFHFMSIFTPLEWLHALCLSILLRLLPDARPIPSIPSFCVYSFFLLPQISLKLPALCPLPLLSSYVHNIGVFLFWVQFPGPIWHLLATFALVTWSLSYTYAFYNNLLSLPQFSGWNPCFCFLQHH